MNELKNKNMSRSKHETSTPQQRGRTGVKKSKRLSSKKVRKLPLDASAECLKKTKWDIVLDKDVPNHPIRRPEKYLK